MGLVKIKTTTAKSYQKNDHIKVAFNIATVVFIYVIVSLIAFYICCSKFLKQIAF